MTKLIASLSIIALSVFASFVSSAADKDVVATVNGTTVYANSLDTYVSLRTGGQQQYAMLNKEQQEQVLQEVINLELLYQDAVTNGIDKTPELKESIEFQRRNLIATYNLRQFLEMTPADDQLKKAYEEKMPGKVKEYQARHILVEEEKDAKAIIKALDKGGDFAKLAKEKSIDPSSAEGGLLEWFSPGQMVAPFSMAVDKLKTGAYTKNPVKTQFGWHVILLEDTRSIDPPPFDTVKEQIRAQLQNEMAMGLIQKLREDAKIELK